MNTPQLVIKKLVKQDARGRIALMGPTGSGKSYTSATLALGLLEPGQRILVIDSERGSFAKYADLFNLQDVFDVIELNDETGFSPETYVAALQAGAQNGYGVIVIDSGSHAWMGKEGALEQVDKFAARSKTSNSFGAWREVTPMHNAFVDEMLKSPAHVIMTLRTKTEYVIEQINGRSVPRKIGMAPVQRDGLEYEFDLVGELDQENQLVITKSRISALQGAVIKKPDVKLATTIKTWLAGSATAGEVVGTVQSSTQQAATGATNGHTNGKPPEDPQKARAMSELRERGWLAPAEASALEAFKTICKEGALPWMPIFLEAVDAGIGKEWDGFHAYALRRRDDELKKAAAGGSESPKAEGSPNPASSDSPPPAPDASPASQSSSQPTSTSNPSSKTEPGGEPSVETPASTASSSTSTETSSVPPTTSPEATGSTSQTTSVPGPEEYDPFADENAPPPDLHLEGDNPRETFYALSNQLGWPDYAERPTECAQVYKQILGKSKPVDPKDLTEADYRALATYARGVIAKTHQEPATFKRLKQEAAKA